jgi:allophanate hydrolase
VTAFAFYGTFTSGQPGHGYLAGARFLERTQTAPRYRLYVVDALPALVEAEPGASIGCEVYDVGEQQLERLAEIEPPGWSRAPLELAAGRRVEAFLASGELAARGEDVSAHGSWAAYADSRSA